MADKPFPWFRTYSEAAFDPKFDIIGSQLRLEPLFVFGVWMKILCIAGASPVRGSLYVTAVKRYSNGDVTNLLRISNEVCNALLDAFIEMDMIDLDENGAYHIKNWNKRQYSSDSSAERVRKHRQKEKMKQECNVTVTPTYVSVSDSFNSSLSDEFTNLTGIIPYNLDEWIRADQTLTAAGVTPEDIRVTLQLMEKQELTVSGLPSIVKTAISCKSKRERHQPIFNGVSSNRLLPDGV